MTVSGLATSGVFRARLLRPCWVAIVGIGGLGHLAVQYAVAMGLRVVAVDVATDKLELARSHGASVVVNAADGDPAAAVHAAVGGVHGVVVAAVATRAFEQAIGMLRPAGTAVYLGMPGGAADEMRMSIGSLIYGELSVRGSSVGTRLDLQEAVDFAVNGFVTSTVRTVQLREINETLAAMRRGEIVGRAVLTFP